MAYRAGINQRAKERNEFDKMINEAVAEPATSEKNFPAVSSRRKMEVRTSASLIDVPMTLQYGIDTSYYDWTNALTHDNKPTPSRLLMPVSDTGT